MTKVMIHFEGAEHLIAKLAEAGVDLEERGPLGWHGGGGGPVHLRAREGARRGHVGRRGTRRSPLDRR
ncbi:MAG: hypothetical protein ACRD0U_06320, partial [Acidimicrobiales bacterium]